MANYIPKTFKRFRQVLCGVKDGRLPQCEKDIADTLSAWESDNSYYDSGISDYEKGIINFWGTSDELCDDDLGLEQLKRAADEGNPNAMNLCAMAYYLLPSQPNLDKEGCRNLAIKYWTDATIKGQAEAMCNLAVCFAEAKSVDRDLQKSKVLFKLAIKAKHPKAKEYLKLYKLDKWKPGSEYDATPGTILVAMDCLPPEPKKTNQEKLQDIINLAIIKSKHISLREAVSVFNEKMPTDVISKCLLYDDFFVFGVIRESLLEEKINIEQEFLNYYKVNKLTGEISDFTVMEMLNSPKNRKVNIDRLIPKKMKKNEK